VVQAKLLKLNNMAQYTTGKIKNPNPSLEVQKVPGSKGINAIPV
jgi:hypothetical protein